MAPPHSRYLRLCHVMLGMGQHPVGQRPLYRLAGRPTQRGQRWPRPRSNHGQVCQEGWEVKESLEISGETPRKAAAEAGLSRYTGFNPCASCGGFERYVFSRQCVKCPSARRAAKWTTIAETLRSLALSMYADGMDLQDIANHINDLGYRTRHGGYFTRGAIAHIMGLEAQQTRHYEPHAGTRRSKMGMENRFDFSPDNLQLPGHI